MHQGAVQNKSRDQDNRSERTGREGQIFESPGTCERFFIQALYCRDAVENHTEDIDVEMNIVL